MPEVESLHLREEFLSRWSIDQCYVGNKLHGVLSASFGKVVRNIGEFLPSLCTTWEERDKLKDGGKSEIIKELKSFDIEF